MQFGEGLTEKIKSATQSIKKAHKEVTDKINLIGKAIKQSDLHTERADNTNSLYSDKDPGFRKDCKVFVSTTDAKQIKAALNKHISYHTKEYLSCTQALTDALKIENNKFETETETEKVKNSMSNPELAKKRVLEHQHKIAECNKKFLAGINKRINIESNNLKCNLSLEKVNSGKIKSESNNVTEFEGNVIAINPKHKTIIVKINSSVKDNEIEIEIKNLCIGGGKQVPKPEVNDDENDNDEKDDAEKTETPLPTPIKTEEQLVKVCDIIEKKQGGGGGSGRRKY